MVHRLVIRAENAYTGLERSQTFPIEHIMTKLSESEVPRAPCPRFKGGVRPCKVEQLAQLSRKSPYSGNL